MELLLNQEGIERELIRVVKVEGLKKQPFGIKWNASAKKVKTLADEWILKKNKRVEYNFEAEKIEIKNTIENIFCFDVDDEKATYTDVIKNYPFLENTLYTTGNSKGYHFYLIIDDMPKYSNEVKVGSGDISDIDLIRYKKCLWEKRGKKWFNQEIKNLNWNEISEYFNIKAMNFETDNRDKNDNIDFPLMENDTIGKLIECLKTDKSENADTWRIIGACIYSELKEAGLPHFINFSRKSKQHDLSDDDIADSYRNICAKYTKYTIGTLCWYAKRDNLHEYNSIFTKDEIDCEDWTALDWAKHMKKNIYDKMRYCFGTWYICENNIWKEVRYNSVVTTQFMIDCIKKRILTAMDISSVKTRDEIINKLQKQRKSIDTGSFASQLDKHNITYFTDETFEEALFSHQEELIFQNGILNMATGDFNEEITPEDYVIDKMIINWDYSKRCDNDKIKFVMDKLLQIHNNSEEQRSYILKCYGYALSGCRKENLFVNLKGVRTGNGKSTISDTLNKICPSLVGVMPQMVLEKNFNKRHKYLMDTLGKRIITFEELPKDKCLDNTFIKDITGGVAYRTEVLFKNTKNIFIYWTPFSNTNFTPKFDGGEDMRRRYSEICCDNKFHSKQDYEELSDEEKKSGLNHLADNDLKNRLLDCKNEIINMLVAYYQRYLQDGLAKPDFVQKWSNETIECNNEGGDWLEEHFEITHDENDFVSQKRVKELLLVAKQLNLKNLKDLLKAKGVKYESQKESKKKNDKWKGAFIGIKEIEDDEE